MATPITTPAADNSAFGGPNAQQAANTNASLGVSGGAPADTNAGTNTGTSDFTGQLQKMLLNQSGIISSDSTQLEGKINSAIDTVKQGNVAGGQAITSQYDRAKADAADKGQTAQTQFQEASRGYATNTAALKQLQDNTTKQVNDLEQRKQELILQGNATAASQIAGMQVQAIQFHQQAQQQVFSNLLGMGNFALQQDQNKQQASQFQQTLGFQQSNAISTIALKYGLTVNPGDTLESITTRAMPLASKEEQMGLDQIQSQIKVNNANAAKALADANATGNPSTIDYEALSDAVANGNQAVLANVKDPSAQAKILGMAATKQGAQIVKFAHDSGDSKETAHKDILANPNLTLAAKAAALDALDSVYKDSGTAAAGPKGTPAYGSPFLNVLNNIGAGIGTGINAVGDFITGNKSSPLPFSPLK